MAKLVSDTFDASPDDLVLELDRVEDARTVRQRFRVPAAHWRAFLESGSPGTTPGSAEQAYEARSDFWDWLAKAHADTPPDEFVAPGVEWLKERYADWRSGS